MIRPQSRPAMLAAAPVLALTATAIAGSAAEPGRGRPEPPAGAFEAEILARAGELGVLDAAGGLNPLIASLRALRHTAAEHDALDAVVDVFRRPLSIDAQEAVIDAKVRAVQERSRTTDPLDWPGLVRAAAGLIRADLPAVPPTDAADGPGGADGQPDDAHRRRARSLVRHMRDHFYLGGPDAAEHRRVITEAGPALPSVLTSGAARFDQRCERLNARLARTTPPGRPAADRAALPGALAAAVEGEVLDHWAVGDRFGVVTGPGPNRIDMSVVAEVIDLGGDDHYAWPADLHDRPGTGSGDHAIIDLGGDDEYESRAESAGPGAGVFGVSLIDDRAGDDTYRSARPGSIGYGLFGVGVIIDRAGNDRYENQGADSGWSTGAGFYGVGLVIDHAGDDAYEAEKLSQGVGGPRGFGAIIDAGGDDRYRANGPHFTSAYGTPGAFLGMSQGFGFGVRGHAAGGVGAIYDDAGDDRYTAGEFSQAGGYYFGLGVLHDRAGNDRYHGDRYAQAFAAHQAAGILVDDQGDDSYRSVTAAGQSGSWDQSVTMLIDRAGDDTHRAEALALGAASMQAVGVFIDLRGDDRYEAPPGSTLGRSGGNRYHYDAQGVFSFSAFFDLGAGDDLYPAHRRNGDRRSTGARDEQSPGDSGLHGIFVDE